MMTFIVSHHIVQYDCCYGIDTSPILRTYSMNNLTRLRLFVLFQNLPRNRVALEHVADLYLYQRKDLR